MYTRAILWILVLTISVHGTFVPRIVGGHNATLGKFPYQALLLKETSFICGGSIITENAILTAAHCIYSESASKFEVVVGTYILSSMYPGVKYSARKLIWHADYNGKKIINDIGLILLTKSITFTVNIQPIRLASVSHIATDEKAVVTGFGRLSNGGTIPNILQEIELKIISEKQCQLLISGLMDSQICTYTQVNEGVCNGDSGGPLVVNGEQVGIVSFGVPCALGIPDVYTKVYSYKQWIAMHAKSTGNSIKLNTDVADTIAKVCISTLIAALTYLHLFV